MQGRGLDGVYSAAGSWARQALLSMSPSTRALATEHVRAGALRALESKLGARNLPRVGHPASVCIGAWTDVLHHPISTSPPQAVQPAAFDEHAVRLSEPAATQDRGNRHLSRRAVERSADAQHGHIASRLVIHGGNVEGAWRHRRRHLPALPVVSADAQQ
jgi:hypothetical protein